MVGVCSSRKIAAACERNLAFRAIVGDDPTDFRTISDFRKIHLAALRHLFLEVLRLAGTLGMALWGVAGAVLLRAWLGPFMVMGACLFAAAMVVAWALALCADGDASAVKLSANASAIVYRITSS